MNIKTVLLYSALLIIAIFINQLEANPIHNPYKKQNEMEFNIVVVSLILLFISLCVGICSQKREPL